MGAACQTGRMFATLHTTAGDIRIELYPNHAPKTVAELRGPGHGEQPWTDPTTGEQRTDPLYAGVVFHRVIDGFMIQGGDPLGTGRAARATPSTTRSTPSSSFNEPYLLAMANAGKRLDPVTGKVGGTNGSQFFISRRDHRLAQRQAHDLRQGRRRREPRRRRQDRHHARTSRRPSGRGHRHRLHRHRGLRPPSASPPTGAQAAPPVCPRHPDRVSYVRCQRCGRPTCPDCQRQASVGIQCVDCVAEAARALPTHPHGPRRGEPTGPAGRHAHAHRPVRGQLRPAAGRARLDRAAGSSRRSAGYFEPWRFLTVAFLHSTANYLHIVFNMVALWFVGPMLEQSLGRARYLTLYLLSAVGGSVGSVLLARDLSADGAVQRRSVGCGVRAVRRGARGHPPARRRLPRDHRPDRHQLRDRLRRPASPGRRTWAGWSPVVLLAAAYAYAPKERRGSSPSPRRRPGRAVVRGAAEVPVVRRLLSDLAADPVV